MSRALFELTARGTGAGGSDEVFTFSEEMPPAVPTHIPTLRSITHSPGVIKIGAVLWSDEWTVELADPSESTGSFWGKTFQRLPYWKGRRARIYWADADGWLELVVFKVIRKRGAVSFVLTTPIRDALSKRVAEFDRPVKLAAAANSSQFSLTIDNAVEVGDWVLIDDELIRTTPNTTESTTISVAGLGRGQRGSAAAAHEQGATVQLVRRYTGNAAAIIRSILVDELGLAGRIDQGSFTEAGSWFDPVRLERFVLEPVKVGDILQDLLELSNGVLAYDEFAGRIRLISRAVWEQPEGDLLDEDSILGGNARWSSSEQPQDQYTRCIVKFGHANPQKTDNIPSAIYVDALAESDEEYDEVKPRQVDASKWLTMTDTELAGDTAEIIAERVVKQHRDTPQRLQGIRLHGATGRKIRVGSVVRVRLAEFRQDADGSSQAVEALVESARRDIFENTTELRLAIFGRYEAGFSPDVIIISTRRFAVNLHDIFGFKSSAFTGLLRIVDNGLVAGNSSLVPAISSGALPAGTEITVSVEGGGIATGSSGEPTQPGSSGTTRNAGGDVFHITSGSVKLVVRDGGCVHPGGGGAASGGNGAAGTNGNNAGGGGGGGHGWGWSSYYGRLITDRQVRDNPAVPSPRELAFGQHGSSGRLRAGLLDDTGAGARGLGGRFTAPATAGGDATDPAAGGGGGGGGEGGEFGLPGEAAAAGGSSGSNAGAQPSQPAAGGKLARVSPGASFTYDSTDPCVFGEVVGNSQQPLFPPTLVKNAQGFAADWTAAPGGGFAVTTVIEEIVSASSQTEVLRTQLTAGTYTNVSSASKSYRARTELAGRSPSEWIYFSLLPEPPAALAEPVINLSSDGRTATFTNAPTDAGNVIYRMQYLSLASNTYQPYRDYYERQAAYTLVNRSGSDSSFRVRAVVLDGSRAASAWVNFVLKAAFVGRLNASRNFGLARGGSTTTYTLSVDEQPDANFTVTVQSSNTGVATVDTTTFTITPANWQTAKTVTVTGVGFGTATITATASGATQYAGQVAIFTASVSHPLSPNFINGPSTATVQAGESLTVSYGLGAMPAADVLVELASSDDDITITPANRTIPRSSWSFISASFTVTASADATPGTVTLTLTCTGGGYDDETSTTTLTVTELIDGYVTVRASPSVSFSQSRIDLNGTTPRTFRIQTTGPAPSSSGTVVNVRVSMHSNTQAAGNIDLTPETIDYDYSQANWSETHDFTIQYDGTGPFALQEPDRGLVVAAVTSGGVESGSFLDLDRGD